LLLAQATAIAVSGAASGNCPSLPAVVKAMAVRLPGMPVSTEAPRAGAWRLSLQPRPSTSASSPALEVSLVDDDGRLLLRRALPAASPARPGDCAALAETVALIVDRYVADVAGAAEPPPPAEEVPLAAASPPPLAPPLPPDLPTTDAAFVGGGAWRSNGDALEGFETMVGVDLQRAARERGAGAWLTVGITPTAEGRWPTGKATLRRLPVRLGTYLSLAAGPGRLEPGLNLGIDTLLIHVQPGGGAASYLSNVSPNVEAAMAYRLRGGIYFARAAAAVGLAVPYRLTGVSDESDGAVSTPRTYIRMGLETGFYFH